MLPRELTERHGVNVRDVMEFRSSSALAAAVQEVAEAAESHLAAARRLRRQIARDALPALLPATLASGYLRQMRRAGHNPFDMRLMRPPALRSLRLVAASSTGDRKSTRLNSSH